jgi:hypothetical protein
MLARFTLACLALVGSMFLVPALGGARPVSTRVVSVPRVVPLQGSEVLKFELRNDREEPVTLCALQGARTSISCTLADGSGVGIGPGGVSKIPRPYDREDFFTLAPGESKRFDVPITVPEGCDADVVTVSVAYESKFDGSEVGLCAWTGKLNVGTFRIPISTR